MQITFLQDYHGVEAGRMFVLDNLANGEFSWSNVTVDGSQQFLRTNVHKLQEQGIVSIGQSFTGLTTATGTTTLTT